MSQEGNVEKRSIISTHYGTRQYPTFFIEYQDIYKDLLIIQLYLSQFLLIIDFFFIFCKSKCVIMATLRTQNRRGLITDA